MLEQAKDVALTGDHWTSVSNDNCLGVTAHFTDKEWNLQPFTRTVSQTEERRYAAKPVSKKETNALANWIGMR